MFGINHDTYAVTRNMKLFKCVVLLVCCVGLDLSAQSVHQSIVEDTTAIQAVVSSYYSGLNEKNIEQVLSCLAEDFFMFNGNYSGLPEDWQAHLYLREKQLSKWVSGFIQEAGPHENEIQFIHTHIRANAAVVVTVETGKNKFRSWHEEKVTWLLGKDSGAWKLIGFFIRDIKNPE